MELIERYVKAVSRRLPASKRASVEAELRSAVLDALEGRAAQTEDDVVAVLREFGDPAQVAAGYHPEGQYLIGPAHYAAFVRVLRIVATSVLLVHGLFYMSTIALGSVPLYAAADHLVAMLESALIATLFGAFVVFLVFMGMQRSGSTTGAAAEARAWDPRKLPAALEADRVSRLEAGFSLLVLVIAMSIVGAIGRGAQNGYDDAPAVLQPLVEGALLTAIPWLIASMAIEAVMQTGLLIEGRRRLGWRVLHVVSDVLAVIAFGVAGVAVLEERAALVGLGMPDVGVTVLGVSTLVVALFIGTGAVTREHRLSRRRAAERAGAPEAPEGSQWDALRRGLIGLAPERFR